VRSLAPFALPLATPSDVLLLTALLPIPQRVFNSKQAQLLFLPKELLSLARSLVFEQPLPNFFLKVR